MSRIPLGGRFSIQAYPFRGGHFEGIQFKDTLFWEDSTGTVSREPLLGGFEGICFREFRRGLVHDHSLEVVSRTPFLEVSKRTVSRGCSVAGNSKGNHPFGGVLEDTPAF